jgi:hypothetical protein
VVVVGVVVIDLLSFRYLSVMCLPVKVSDGVALLCGAGYVVPSDGFVSSRLVAFAAGDACVGDGVGAAPRVGDDVVWFGAGWLECGSPS